MSNLRQTCKLLMLLLASATLSFAQQEKQDAKPPSPYYLLLEPAFMKPEIKTPVPGAMKTLVVPAIREGDNFRYMTVKEMRDLGMPRADFDRMARQNSSKILAQIFPEYVRGANSVIEFAVLQTENHTAATAVLAPDFVNRFAKVFGPEIVVMIPNRDKVYIFPKLAGRFEQMSQLILDEFAMSPYPVSREVFEIKDGGLQAFATFDRH